MLQLTKNFWLSRELIFELSKRELFQGHANHLFGGVWVFVNPMITLAVYFIVFHFIFPSRIAGNESSELFLIAGLIQWITLSEIMARACSIIRTNSNLVKQINFPVEALVARSVASAVFVQVIMTVGLFILAWIIHGSVPLSSLGVWLAAMTIQTIFMLGVALTLAAITPFVPDLAELVGVVVRLGLYVTPILYSSSQFRPSLENLFYLNPFSYFAWIHQQVFSPVSIVPVAWLGATALGIAAFWLGARLFRTMSPAFNDVL